MQEVSSPPEITHPPAAGDAIERNVADSNVMTPSTTQMCIARETSENAVSDAIDRSRSAGVREEGLEPSPLAGQEPKSCASASSATLAMIIPQGIDIDDLATPFSR
jgi:hypothetical protein